MKKVYNVLIMIALVGSSIILMSKPDESSIQRDWAIISITIFITIIIHCLADMISEEFDIKN